MFNLREYKHKTDHLSDVLPWALLAAPGIILNKDGSLQRTLRFRGKDNDSSTEAELVQLCAHVNNALKRLGSGWVIYCEAQRSNTPSITRHSHFPDPVSYLIDLEREAQFNHTGNCFETQYFLTLQYQLAKTQSNQTKKWFIHNHANEVSQDQKQLQLFEHTTEQIYQLLRDSLYDCVFLNDDDTLTYLHSTISNTQHIVRTPETPMYLDAFLADTPLSAGLELNLGNQPLDVISVLNLPGSTFPNILDNLQALAIPFRWMTRYIALDKLDAENTLKKYRQRWFAKRKSLLHLITEIFTKQESALQDTAAIEKAHDVALAQQALADDHVNFGFYTAVIVLSADNRDELNEYTQMVTRVLHGAGLTTIRETINAMDAWLSSLPGQAYANVRKPLIHSLNLAHLLPLSANWPGQMLDTQLNAPALMTTQTRNHTPFYYALHVGDVGHTLVLGPTGSGKSVFLSFMALQFRRYKNAQVFIFDKGGSLLGATYAAKGKYTAFNPANLNHSLQPLQAIDEASERAWANEWLHILFSAEKINLTPHHKTAIHDALETLASFPQKKRTLSALHALLQDHELRSALNTYTQNGPHGYLFDAESHEDCAQVFNKEGRFSRQSNWECFEMENLMQTPSIITPVLLYLFHRLEKRFTGQPSLLILDEAWLFLDSPIFASKIRDWLKTLRKHNVSVVFATQSLHDALSTSIAPALLDACLTRIYLPNPRANEPVQKTDCEKLGLNARQIELITHAQPKSEYYLQSPLGNRLFDLQLGQLALAVCAHNNKTAQRQWQTWRDNKTYPEFLNTFLSAFQLDWALEAIHAKEVISDENTI